MTHAAEAADIAIAGLLFCYFAYFTGVAINMIRRDR